MYIHVYLLSPSMCVHLYVHNKYTQYTPVYYVNRNVFWMRLIIWQHCYYYYDDDVETCWVYIFFLMNRKFRRTVFILNINLCNVIHVFIITFDTFKAFYCLIYFDTFKAFYCLIYFDTFKAFYFLIHLKHSIVWYILIYLKHSIVWYILIYLKHSIVWYI